MASAGLSDIEEFEVQELRDTSGVNLMTEWARNLGATCRQSAYEAALNKRFDVGIHGRPAKLFLMTLAVAVSLGDLRDRSGQQHKFETAFLHPCRE